MSLRCSLLGHSYGEAEIEREREEQGSEVVVTVREFEECARCGDQNVLSENKEVTAVESPAPDLESAETDSDVDSDPTAAESVDSTDSAAATGTGGVGDSSNPDVDSADDGAEIITDSADADESGSAGTSATGGGSAGADGASESTAASTSGDAGTESAQTGGASGDSPGDSPDGADDGVILDDDADADDGDRQPGEWPDAETTHPADAEAGEYTEWPEVDTEDEGFDAEPGGGSADVEFGGGLTPESAPEVDESESDEVEFVNAEGDALQAHDEGGESPELSSGISAGAEAPSVSGPAEDPDVDAEFVCPECDYRDSVSGSSLRAGDICPECARGYLATE